MKPVVKILFVCHGNICRSPMAEFMMKDMVRREGLEARFEIASAATSAEELGSPVYPAARERLRRAGVSCAGKTARRMTRDDYDRYDLLVGMDRQNLRNMLRITGGDPDGKLHTLLSFAGSDREVADPWYTGDFDAAFDDVTAGCRALLQTLKDD